MENVIITFIVLLAFALLVIHLYKVAKKKQKIISLNEEIDSLNANVADLRWECESVSRDLKEKEQQRQLMKSELEKLQYQKSNAKETLETIQSEVDSATQSANNIFSLTEETIKKKKKKIEAELNTYIKDIEEQKKQKNYELEKICSSITVTSSKSNSSSDTYWSVWLS